MLQEGVTPTSKYFQKGLHLPQSTLRISACTFVKQAITARSASRQLPGRLPQCGIFLCQKNWQE